MIIKSYEIEKVNLNQKKILLFYGDNEGYKDEIINDKFKKKFEKKTYIYDEVEILKNEKTFFDEILSQSFFEKEKLIIINRSTDKIAKIAEEILDKNLSDVIVIFNSERLEKKSKLRSLFEKNRDLTCCAFYPDDFRSLSIIINNFFRDKKISISQEILNTIIEKCNGSRQTLKNELQKIESYIFNKKKIDLDQISKLTNPIENIDVSQLVDTCLAKKQKKVVQILNENNFSKDEVILIIRTFLIKAKRLLKIRLELQNNKNIDNVLTSFKPPIFWKDKTLVKQQVQNYSSKSLEQLIISINNTELLVKNNFDNSLNILFDFIFQETKATSN